MKALSVALLLLLAAPAAAQYELPTLRVSYANGGERFSVDPSGGDRRHEASGVPADAVPSPDGTRLAYVVATGDARTELRVAAADGSFRRTVATVKSSYLKSPAWSDDGTQLAFVSGGPTRIAFQTAVEVVGADGTGRRVVTRKLTAGYDLITHVTWGPDGLYYAQGVSGAPIRSDVHRIGLDGTGDSVFLADAKDGVWSPDGAQFAFGDVGPGSAGTTCGPDDCFANADLAVADAAGTRRVLARTPADETQAAWSPDGSRLAFASARNLPDPGFGDTEIYSVATDGSCLTWLTNGSPASSAPRWSGTGSAAPATCGDADRAPHVTVRSRSPLSVGPRFGTALLVASSRHESTYGDCSAFEPRACDPGFALFFSRACRVRPRDVAGAVRRAGRHRIAFGRRTFVVGRWRVQVGGKRIDPATIVAALRGRRIGPPRLPAAVRATLPRGVRRAVRRC